MLYISYYVEMYRVFGKHYYMMYSSFSKTNQKCPFLKLFGQQVQGRKYHFKQYTCSSLRQLYGIVAEVYVIHHMYII